MGVPRLVSAPLDATGAVEKPGVLTAEAGGATVATRADRPPLVAAVGTRAACLEVGPIYPTGQGPIAAVATEVRAEQKTASPVAPPNVTDAQGVAPLSSQRRAALKQRPLAEGATRSLPPAPRVTQAAVRFPVPRLGPPLDGTCGHTCRADADTSLARPWVAVPLARVSVRPLLALETSQAGRPPSARWPLSHPIGTAAAGPFWIVVATAAVA